jgi:hypothetical protein
MGYYVNTRKHYELRQNQITEAILRRAYFEGHPYTDDPVTHYFADTWTDLMTPDRPSRTPIYYDNIARILIENTVSDILPSESVLRIPGTEEMEDKQRKQFFEQLFNLGPGYERSPSGFLSWCGKVLKDTAQPGDSLIFNRLVPGKSPRVEWNFYPMEAWTVEEGVDSIEPLFYRIEYRYDKVEGESVLILWHRLDIWRDRLIRYHDTPALWQAADTTFSDPRFLRPGADSNTSLMPPQMSVMESPEYEAENAVLRELDDWVCTPLLWDRGDPRANRGTSSLRKNRLQGIDQVNRELSEWADAAIQHGNPDLFAIDLRTAEDEEERKDIGEGRKTDIISGSSDGLQQGKISYPDNLPTQLLHEKALDALRQAVFEGTPNFSINPENITRFGELSGFATGQLNKQHDAKVKQLRDDLVRDGLLVALKRALKLLKISGSLPDGVEPDAEITIKLSSRQFSPAEEQQMSTVFSSLQDRGIPADDLLAYASKFLDVKDENEFREALEEYKSMKEEMFEITKIAKEQKPSPANESPSQSDKRDNRQK